MTGIFAILHVISMLRKWSGKSIEPASTKQLNADIIQLDHCHWVECFLEIVSHWLQHIHPFVFALTCKAKPVRVPNYGQTIKTQVRFGEAMSAGTSKIAWDSAEDRQRFALAYALHAMCSTTLEQRYLPVLKHVGMNCVQSSSNSVPLQVWSGLLDLPTWTRARISVWPIRVLTTDPLFYWFLIQSYTVAAYCIKCDEHKYGFQSAIKTNYASKM